MQKEFQREISEYLVHGRRKKRWSRLVMALACVAVFCTTYILILPAITAESPTYCGKEEHTHSKRCYEKNLLCSLDEKEEGHTHTEECYETEKELSCTILEGEGGHIHTEECQKTEQVLTCELAEDERHTHGASCYTEQTVQICGMEESQGHLHSEACYTEEARLVCGQPEEPEKSHTHTDACYEEVLVCGKEEHTHTPACHSNTEADVENDGVWENTLPKELTGDWAKDVLAVAKSQLGYTESTENFITDSENKKKGYSRYGAWYGDPYGDWCAMFVSFCLHYAEIPSSAMPYEASCPRWIALLQSQGMYEEAADTTPNPGDLVFFDQDGDGTSDHVGLAEMLDEEKGELHTIEGNSGNQVRRMAYLTNDSVIMGYGRLPRKPRESDGEPVSEETEAATGQDGESQATAQMEAPQKSQETADNPEETQRPQDMFAAWIDREMADAGTWLENGRETEESKSPVTPADARRAGDEMNFGQWLTGVDVQHRPGWSQGAWNDLENGQVELGDNIRFTLEYEIPGNELEGSNKIIYQLPEQIHAVKGASGNVMNGSAAVGTYVVSENGKIEITFDEAYANENQNGKMIKGFISFEASAESMVQGPPEDVNIKFNENVSATITVTDPNVKDLSVAKAATNVNEKEGTVEYTIRVSSAGGTGKEITLKDVMQNIAGDGSFTVSKQTAGGAASQVAVSPQTTEHGFNLTLPKLEAGESYTVTYTAKVPEDKMMTGTWTQNAVTAETTNQKDVPLKEEAKADVTFTQHYVEKSGEKQNDGGVLWTITVNADQKDIGGWTLSDKFNGADLSGQQVEMTDSAGNKTMITLPHTFADGCTDSYQIVYKTDWELGEESVRNEAVLTKDDTHISSGDKWVWIGNRDLVSKQADGIQVQPDKKTAIVGWTAQVKGGDYGIEPEWFYRDELQDGQWFTEEQMQQIKDEVKAAADALHLGYRFETVSSGGRDTGYKVIFTDPLKAGESLTFSYTSTASLGDGMQSMWLHNKGILNDKIESTGSIEYKPDLTVRKYDLTNNSADDTQHGYFDDVLDKEGVLKWGILVTLGQGYDGKDLVVTEKLPQHVDLTRLDVKAEGVFGDMSIIEDGSHVQNGYEIQTSQVGQTVTVTIPEELVKNPDLKELRFTVYAKIRKDEVEWEQADNKDVYVFENRVEVSDEDKKIEASDGQNQTVVGSRDVLSKSHGEVKDNVVPYSIILNPDGKDLLPGEDTLHMKDVLEFGSLSDETSAYLDLSSLHMYRLEADGTKGEELDLIKVVQNVEKVPNQYWWHKKYILEMTVPDGTPLLVEYKYVVNADAGVEVEMKNQVSLDGYTASSGEGSNSFKYHVTDSSAGSHTEGVTIYKVDSVNQADRLDGAKFMLYHYVKASGTYEPVVDTKTGQPAVYVSGAEGEAGKISLSDMTYNTAYRLMEIEAPDGYNQRTEPYEFYIYHKDKAKYPDVMPDGFTGKSHEEGEQVPIANERKPDSTKITVKKRWLDAEGKDITIGHQGSIEFELWRKASTQKPAGSTNGLVTFTTVPKNSGADVPRFHETYPAGTVITCELIYKWWQYNQPDVHATVGGKAITITPVEETTKKPEDQEWKYFRFTLTLNEDVEVVLDLGDAHSGNWNESRIIDVIEPENHDSPNPGAYGDDVLVGTYTLDHANKWQKVFHDLPRTGRTQEDADGTWYTVYYTYYIKEIPANPQYDISYAGNDAENGKVSGTITITNRLKEEFFELPETGGMGTFVYTFGGLALIAGACLGGVYRRRRQITNR